MRCGQIRPQNPVRTALQLDRKEAAQNGPPASRSVTRTRIQAVIASGPDFTVTPNHGVRISFDGCDSDARYIAKFYGQPFLQIRRAWLCAKTVHIYSQAFQR